VITTTTPTVEGRTILEYRGIVTSSAVLTHPTWLEEMGSLISGKDEIVQAKDANDVKPKSLQGASQLACRKLEAAAEALGANAIVGVTIEHQLLRLDARVYLFATGTAVVLA